MSTDPDFEKRINNQLATIVENQGRHDTEIGRILEAVAGMIQVARSHEERIDDYQQRLERTEKQTEENSKQIAALVEQGKEQQERINALIKIVEGHLTNHP